ncbi:efflux transporter outer membrane subunit [Hippea jasoniae]|uniref:efflux transporter outer membrane subunit n=1 Tax=Hippea jasoniae TaxID=944479 RepID=UPI0005536AE7|nr:TolC family protein [Hippea jasoniae]
MKKIVFVIIFAILLTSCSTQKPIKLPKIALPATKDNNTLVDTSWWRLFGDRQLSKLINSALKNNDNLLIAKQRLKEAQMLYSISQSNLYPSIDLSASFSRNKYPKYTRKPISNSYSTSAVFTYNPDFFGKLTSLKQASFERFLAQKEQLRSVKLNITQSISNSYIDLCLTEKLLNINRKISKAAEDLNTINKKLLKAGLIAQTELNNSAIFLLNTKQSLQSLLLTKKIELSGLAVLLGKNPKEMFDFNINCSKLPEPIQPPAFLPSEVIKKRPDIMAAEKNLLASGFDFKAKERELFPSITLTTETGFNSAKLNKLIRPDSEFFSIALQLIEHLFSFGKVSKQIKLAKLKQKEAALIYIKTIKEAFKEIHDCLQNLKTTKQNLKNQQAILKNQQAILNTIIKKYTIGLANKSELLKGQISYLKQLQNTETLKAQYIKALVNLYVALGGGWKQ